MKLNQVFDFVNYICAKELSGETLTPVQFNNILSFVNIDMYNKKIAEAEMYANQNQMPISDVMLEHKYLLEFHYNQAIVLAGGAYDLTGLTHTFGYLLGLFVNNSGRLQEIEFVTELETIKRRTNLLTAPVEEYPVAYMYNSNSIAVLPSNISAATIYYVSIPATPIYDYYIDANANKVYLEVDATHLLTTGEAGSSGEVAGQTVTSKTVELEWNQLRHPEICFEILKKVSPNLNKPEIFQYATQETLKNA